MQLQFPVIWRMKRMVARARDAVLSEYLTVSIDIERRMKLMDVTGLVSKKKELPAGTWWPAMKRIRVMVDIIMTEMLVR